jgi:hypothetical protein
MGVAALVGVQENTGIAALMGVWENMGVAALVGVQENTGVAALMGVWKNMGVAALVGLHGWLGNVAQAETSVLVCCRGRFVKSLTTTFLVLLMPHNFWVTFLICCFTRWSALTYKHKTRFIRGGDCDKHFCLASNLASALWLWGRRRFPNRWLGFCFGLIAIHPCFVAIGNVSQNACSIRLCALNLV